MKTGGIQRENAMARGRGAAEPQPKERDSALFSAECAEFPRRNKPNLPLIFHRNRRGTQETLDRIKQFLRGAAGKKSSLFILSKHRVELGVSAGEQLTVIKEDAITPKRQGRGVHQHNYIIGTVGCSVEEILSGENVEKQTVEVSRLKTAVDTVGQASGPVAQLLMDRAMDAMLRKRGIIS